MENKNYVEGGRQLLTKFNKILYINYYRKATAGQGRSQGGLGARVSQLNAALHC